MEPQGRNNHHTKLVPVAAYSTVWPRGMHGFSISFPPMRRITASEPVVRPSEKHRNPRGRGLANTVLGSLTALYPAMQRDAQVRAGLDHLPVALAQLRCPGPSCRKPRTTLRATRRRDGKRTATSARLRVLFRSAPSVCEAHWLRGNAHQTDDRRPRSPLGEVLRSIRPRAAYGTVRLSCRGRLKER